MKRQIKQGEEIKKLINAWKKKSSLNKIEKKILIKSNC